MDTKKFVIISLFLLSSVIAQDSSQIFLSLRNTVVESFQKSNPHYDGIEDYTFVMVPGFANEPSNIKIKVTEKTYFAESIAMVIKHNAETAIKMYPNISYTLNCNYEIP